MRTKLQSNQASSCDDIFLWSKALDGQMDGLTNFARPCANTATGARTTSQAKRQMFTTNFNSL